MTGTDTTSRRDVRWLVRYRCERPMARPQAFRISEQGECHQLAAIRGGIEEWAYELTLLPEELDRIQQAIRDSGVLLLRKDTPFGMGLIGGATVTWAFHFDGRQHVVRHATSAPGSMPALDQLEAAVQRVLQDARDRENRESPVRS